MVSIEGDVGQVLTGQVQQGGHANASVTVHMADGDNAPMTQIQLTELRKRLKEVSELTGISDSAIRLRALAVCGAERYDDLLSRHYEKFLAVVNEYLPTKKPEPAVNPCRECALSTAKAAASRPAPVAAPMPPVVSTSHLSRLMPWAIGFASGAAVMASAGAVAMLAAVGEPKADSYACDHGGHVYSPGAVLRMDDRQLMSCIEADGKFVWKTNKTR
ncbi:hypothetical protein LH426_11695 [Laribacter hongkongensis]|uniref:hypothetical protein n=1 Tax=Laribacter hongkongensis TaxID=168471 RepID=UPI001EFD0AB3|nr:hypothetical protein [Laribacter hongkongensis]MCG9005131.1 hypothetical protein [Laribacter hongkongensis]